MRIVSTFVLFLAVILKSIDLSSQATNTGPSVFRSTHSPAGHHALRSSRRSSPADTPLRARSNSSVASHSPLYVLGYTLEQLRYIRLIPHTNPSRQFEIQRYTFPRDKSIQVRGRHQVLVPMPTEEQTVLSTSDGEVFAIAEDYRRLRGIYIMIGVTKKRAKINMHSGKVEIMTAEEIRETPLGRKYEISKCFEVLHIDTVAGSSAQISNPRTGVSPSRIAYFSDRHHDLGSLSRSLPPDQSPLHASLISAPSSDSPLFVLGYKLEELKFIRLIPHANPFRRFEVRRYTFPRGKLIHLRGRYNARVPMPIEEQTVLSTADGEVFAIVADDRRLRGIYTIKITSQKRAKINMYNGVIDVMTAEEIKETAITKNSVISNSFSIVRVSDSPPRLIQFPILNRF